MMVTTTKEPYLVVENAANILDWQTQNLIQMSYKANINLSNQAFIHRSFNYSLMQEAVVSNKASNTCYT